MFSWVSLVKTVFEFGKIVVEILRDKELRKQGRQSAELENVIKTMKLHKYYDQIDFYFYGADDDVVFNELRNNAPDRDNNSVS